MFLSGNNWRYLTQGLLRTLIIAAAAVLMGTVLGFLVGGVRASYDKNGGKLFRTKGANTIFAVINWLCRLYLTVIRGTPVVVQLMIIYFVVFASSSMNPMVSAMLAFGLNSGAYVAEIVRGGIMAVDNGQFEAGRSLGFNYFATMRHIILPQAFKNILPALGNEFVTMIKETSLASTFYIGELMYTRTLLMSTKFYAWQPLIIIAAIYFVVTFVLSKGIQYMEKRMSVSD